MPGIFISYRRADSDGWAGRLRDALRARFGNRVFQDVESIGDGEIFSEVIGRALEECDVALIIIGPNWASARNDDGRRLDQREDWVRTETALVLNRGIRVIPVLVGGASMPRAEDLPDELKSLTLRQAREIRSNSWDSDVAMLTNHLRQIVGRRRAWPRYAAASLAIAALGAAAAAWYFTRATPPTTTAERASPPAAVAQAQPDKPAASQPAITPQPAAAPQPAIAPKPPGTPEPAKAPQPAKVVQPAEPRVATAPPPQSRPPATAPQPPTQSPPARQAQEPDPPKLARAEQPPAKSAADAAPPEPRKPAAAPPVEAPAAAPTQVASLNLPNRPASARELKVGDSWTYRLREIQFSKDLATVTHEISGGDKGGIREMLRQDGGATQRRLPLEPRIFEQRLDGQAMLFEFAPFMPAYAELQPGLTWSKIAGATSTDSINSWRFTGKVTGRERVRVPAGTFEAIKAELEGQLHLSDPLPRDPQAETTVAYQTYTVWFAPEVGRAIKYERRTFNRVRRLLEHEQYELVRYRLQ